MRLGERMDRQYQRAVAELDDARRDGELTDEEYAEHHDLLTAAYERTVDDVAERIKEYGYE